MEKDRFVVNPSKTESIVWTVEDNVSGIGITFVEGDLFDTCRYFVIDKAKCKNKNVDSIVANITKWIGENHLDLVVCNVSARCRAIWLLNEYYSLAVITRAIKGISPNDVDMANASDILFNKVRDYVLTDDGENEFNHLIGRTRLLGAVSMLSDKEAMELFCVASVYWNYKAKAEIEVGNYAADIAHWPDYLPREQQNEAMGNDSKFIEAENFELEEEEEEE